MHNRLKNENHSNENPPDESKTETTDLSSAPISGKYYGSTSLQDESVPRCYAPWCGLIFYVMAFFGFFSTLLLRSGLSVAIVAMVNQTAVADEDVVMSNVTEDQRPRDPELQRYEDGEFNWDRNQQGIVLAAFYYGHPLLEVGLYVRNISGLNVYEDIRAFCLQGYPCISPKQILRFQFQRIKITEFYNQRRSDFPLIFPHKCVSAVFVQKLCGHN